MVRLVEATLAEWIALESDDGVPTEQLTRKSKRFAYDRSLLTCLVDRWRPETHTFHFPWGEMAPTLQDVSYLLGLPLAGEAIGPLRVSSEWCNDMNTRFKAAWSNAADLSYDSHGPRYNFLEQFQVNILTYLSTLSSYHSS